MKKLSSNNVEPLLERSLFFMADLEDKILEIFEKKDNDLWRYIDDIFFIWEHG